MATRVKNRKGSADDKCAPCGTWLRHWENGTGEKKTICGTTGCSNTPIVGAHVMKVGGSDNDVYITPICAKCNARTDEFDVVWVLYGAALKGNCAAP